MTEAEVELDAAVERAFERTARGLERWPDPHRGRSRRDEEYSRTTNPSKWLILPARAEAWVEALVEARVAVVERDARPRWSSGPGPTIVRANLVLPVASGALALVVAISRLEDLDAGVTIGVGDPAECIVWFPDCGCDACDSGSQNEVDHLDAHVRGIITGRFRLLTSRTRTITVIDDSGWSASGSFRRGEVERVLADPVGWHELSGRSWIDR